MSSKEIEDSIYVHENPDVDISILDISSRVGEIPQGLTIKSEDLFHAQSVVSAECADDIIVVGFPRGFYDRTNHFPIVKKGIIASGWGSYFEGESYFLIDAKLFSGSSGSAVLTKPSEQVFTNGKRYESKSGKRSVLLGVYSGEPYLGDESSPEYLDVGIVWYSQNITEILVGKKLWSSSDTPTVSIGSMINPCRRRRE